MDAKFARRIWQLLEPCHAVVYFAPEAREIYANAGLRGGWMGYFASRAAALGPVPAEVVTATFYNIHPRMVGRAIPDAWRFSTPEKILAARLRVADVALRRLLADLIGSDQVRAAADIARRAARACHPIGRPLFAAHSSLPWPDRPHLILWHAATLLREHRGDAHVATLLSNRIDGCEANVLISAEGLMPAEMQWQFRGWSQEEWAAAQERLQARGLVDPDGRLTEAGKELRVSIEATTDALSVPPYAAIGEASCAELASHLLELQDHLSRHGAVPFPNPMGLTRA